MVNKETTVLVTCVGSGVGQSVIDSLNFKGGYRIVGCDGNRNVYAHGYCNLFIEVPSLYSEGYLDCIIEICKQYKVDIVIPGHDHELLLFAQNITSFKKEGIEVLVSEPSIIEISRDKKRWYDYFSEKGCRIVPTYFVSDFKKEVDSSIFPAIVKPCGGSASQGISIVKKEGDLENLKGEDIIQPYLFPEETDENYKKIKERVAQGKFVQMSEISIQLIFDKNARYRGIYISKNSLKNGVPIFVSPIEAEGFEYTDAILKFVPILEKQGVKGPVNIQGRITDKGIYFFEMNMRFTGITGNRALFGFNEVAFLVDNFLGKENSKLGKYTLNKLGVRQVACATIPNVNVNNKDKVVTILGGGSQIGQSFIQDMLGRCNRINLIVREKAMQKYTELFGNNSNITLVVATDSYLSNVFAETDVLVNFVSALAYKEPATHYDAVRYIYQFIPKITLAQIPLILNVSSQSVYDQEANIEKDESCATVIGNSYSFQKIMIEEFFESAKTVSVNSQVMNLRLPRVLNPNQTCQLGFFGTIVSNYLHEKETHVTYPNNNTNLIHIKDVSRAIQFLISKDSDYSGVLNVSGENITMKEYANLVAKLIPEKRNAIKMGDEEKIQNSSMLNGGVFQSMGWEPKYSIKDMLSEIIKNYRR